MREQFSFNCQMIMYFVTLFFRSCLLPNTKANDVRSFDGTVNLFFDEHIMDVIVHKTNKKITNTFSCLRSKPSFVESDKYTSVRETDLVEVNAFLGSCILEVYLVGIFTKQIIYLVTMKDALLSGQSCRIIGPSFCLATFDDFVD